MTIALGFHLFPFRTEKLSPVTPMVLRNSGRVGSRRFFQASDSALSRRLFLCPFYSPALCKISNYDCTPSLQNVKEFSGLLSDRKYLSGQKWLFADFGWTGAGGERLASVPLWCMGLRMPILLWCVMEEGWAVVSVVWLYLLIYPDLLLMLSREGVSVYLC